MPLQDRSAGIVGGERERLAHAHHEICTALTVVRSNVELVRLRLAPGGGAGAVQIHLAEVEAAVDRLREVAHEIKRWHDGLALAIVPVGGPRLHDRGTALRPGS